MPERDNLYIGAVDAKVQVIVNPSDVVASNLAQPGALHAGTNDVWLSLNSGDGCIELFGECARC